ncbi:phage late control D family protein [Massilia antarctica]|uniref:phage late control D family protein n=1 Tax=Massilia antarctica TaxID=2765360 RepID=UPI0006BB796C|nr:contractile injection system protein, VgrG/Pvc8 family [Massilia sp. H27-R4]MCY0916463.1 contractile injection system protein, VgrG/Pvc8 family [Massilia sp. H27-R4]CUI07394.1 Phage protein D [Janthinobacterium sp. CG23_2]CUU31180.1 Phage protein D [Janthinobacterium sp. CG23_2]
MTTAAIPIYQGQDFYVPSFEVRLDGRPPGREVVRDILSVSYKDSLQDIDSFDITINNWDAQTRSFKYSDSDLFDPGKRLDLSMGYRDGQRTMLKGEITSLRPSFPAGGGSTLTISGLNILHRFRTQQESRTYVGRTDSQIAEEIGQRLHVEVDAAKSPGEPTFDYLIQDNQYDIVFLMERARQAGYDTFIEERDSGAGAGTVLAYRPSTSVHRSTYRLSYGKSLIEFQPELTTANQVSKVTVRGWDNARKEPIDYTATRAELATRGVGERGGQAAIDKSIEARAEIIATKPVASQAEAQSLALQILEGIAKEMVKATGSVPGLPDIRAGTVLEIDGVGERFSGRYFVVGTTHAIGDSGYTTQFECRREEL